MQIGRNRVYYVCRAGLIAALYTVLTVILGSFGSGIVQCRISEALCVLPIFTSAAIPGLTLGCAVSGLLTGCLWQDVLFGSLATFLGAVGARLLRRRAWLVPLPTVVFNTAVLPFVLAYAYRVEEGLPFLFFSIGVGEVISAYVLGLLLLFALKRRGKRMRID